MKKAIAAALALTLMFALSATAFAADETTITTAVTPDYAVVIPTTVNVTYLDTNDYPMTLSAQNFRIHSDKKVTVTVASASGFNLTLGASQIPYTLKSPGTTGNGDLVAEFTESGMTKNLSIAVSAAQWAQAAAAGNHTDTLTFTLSYVNR